MDYAVKVAPYKIPHPFRKLKKELIDVIVKDIAEGAPQRFAAEANGITETIFYMWLEQGRVDIDCNIDSLASYLVKSLALIRMIETKKCRNAIVSDEKGHKGAEWTLEHAYWRYYGSNVPAMELAAQIEKMKADLKEGAIENGKEAKEMGASHEDEKGCSA